MSATIMGKNGMIELKELKKIPCPAPEGIWKPVPHHEVIENLIEVAKENDVEAPLSSLQVTVDKTGKKMFGIIDVVEMVGGKELAGEGNEYGFSMGFRNSHDKSLSLRLVLGTKVFVCDNLMMIGEGEGSFEIHKIHTKNLDVKSLMNAAFAHLRESAKIIDDEFQQLQGHKLSLEMGSDMLFDLVEAQALPATRIVQAHWAWKESWLGNPAPKIEHRATAWALQQAVTAQWKVGSSFSIPWRSNALRRFMRSKFVS